MVALFFATTISCSDAFSIIHRVSKVVGLSNQQRIEIIQVIKQSIPTCPVIIEKDGRRKSD